MFDIKQFLEENRACLIAPAGYGKTHTIVECLKALQKRQLVLTHTHAGVASLKLKLVDAKIPSSLYELSTISAFAQRLAVSYTRSEHAARRAARNPEYFNWVISRAKELAECKFIADLVASSYGGVIVDEYQDCTIKQHDLIVEIARQLPLRALGDPLQGIFGFRDNPIVDFDTHLSGFSKYELSTPHRWIETNPILGNEIADLRRQLQSGPNIDFSRFTEIKYKHLSFADYQRCFIGLCHLLCKEGTTVVIVSDSMGRDARTNVARFFNGSCSIVEAIDDREFYEMAQLMDGLNKETAKRYFYSIASRVFFKAGVDEWISDKGVKTKKDIVKRRLSEPLSEAMALLGDAPTSENFCRCLQLLSKLPNVTVLNHEKYFSLLSASHIANVECTTVLDSMVKERDMVRGVGRKIRQFAVGTTLLTKGLEFDNVIVVNKGNKFNLNTLSGKRNFYVAISRACRKLHIIDVG